MSTKVKLVERWLLSALLYDYGLPIKRLKHCYDHVYLGAVAQALSTAAPAAGSCVEHTLLDVNEQVGWE